jgi:hypothetical protein
MNRPGIGDFGPDNFTGICLAQYRPTTARVPLQRARTPPDESRSDGGTVTQISIACRLRRRASSGWLEVGERGS